MGEEKVMIMYEHEKVKEIDRRILRELKGNLEIGRANVDLVRKEEVDRIFTVIDAKKQAIFTLFQGDFSSNEQNIKAKLGKNNIELTLHDRVANNVICKRIQAIFDRIIKQEPRNNRLISVCADRQFFIERVMAENIQTSFIQACIEEDIEK